MAPGPSHLAQANVAYAIADHDDPRMADFMARLDEINQLAERSPGFVWRYVSDSRDRVARGRHARHRGDLGYKPQMRWVAAFRSWFARRRSRAEKQLLQRCRGDEEQAERLIRYELTRRPRLSRAAASHAALERWARDR